MRRGVFDTLRRGLDNTVANWPLILIRIAATILMLIVVVVAVIAMFVPILVSIGIRFADVQTPDGFASAAELLAARWVLLLWIVAALTGLGIVLIAMHAFVQAGLARVYVDGERIAGPELPGQRSRFRVFSMSRWFAGAVDGVWTLFWIYNLAWGAASLLLLVPLVPTLAMMLILHETPAAVAATGCLGLLATLALLVLVGVLTTIWTTRAIAEWAVHRAGVRDALASGWQTIRGDFIRHLLIALALIVVGMAGGTLFSSFSFLVSFGESVGDSAVFTLVTLPFQLIASLLSSAVSAAVSSWYLASYAALAVEGSDPLAQRS